MSRSPVLQPLLNHPTPRCQETLARLLAPLTIWICVSVTLRYGFYGNARMVLGPSSSRMVESSSILVKQIEVRDDDRKEVSLHGFTEKPELNQVLNWSLSDYMIVGSYNRKGFSLWLNEGSRIRMRWEAQNSSFNHLQVNIIKGERDYKTLQPNRLSCSNSSVFNDPTFGKEAEYIIEEGDRYYVGVTNTHHKSIIMTMIVNVSSAMYDTGNAKSTCSTSYGSCRLKLSFPNTQYVVVTTPNNGDIDGSYVEISYVARMVTYIGILVFMVIVVILALKYFGLCDGENETNDAISVRQVSTETTPIMSEKPSVFKYGTGEEDEECAGSADSISSEELYDGKICVICYDEQRNCFFVPCGHCATCFDCAQRIMVMETKACPICRRPVHRVRKLFNV